MRRQAADWEKIFAKHISDEGQVFKIHKQYLRLNNNKINKLIKIQVKYLKRHLAKEDIQMANAIMKNAQHHMSLGNYRLKQQ